MLWPIAFASKSLSHTEWMYSNIEREALRILYGLEKFHHYYFADEVHVITYHKQLVVIRGKDVAMLWQCLQCIIWCIHQDRVCILFKPGPELFILDCPLWHNHKENKDKEICGLNKNVNEVETVVDLAKCTSICNIQEATAGDMHLQELKAYIIKDWSHKKEDVAQDIQKYWPIRHWLVMIDSMVVKGKWVMITSQFQVQLLKQLHSNHMEIEKTRLLAHEFVNLVIWMQI